MGSHRLAAIAAVSHGRHYYNHTQPEVTHTQPTPYSANVLFISATICGVLVAVMAACWRRGGARDKPDDEECRGVYTVSADVTLHQVQDPLPGPPPAYETVVIEDPDILKDAMLQEVVADHPYSSRGDIELPSYEAAVLLKDTKL